MTDFENWRKHINRVIEDDGVWVGLLDENWHPICDVPVAKLKESRTRMAAGQITADVIVGEHSQVVDELVAEGLGDTDQQGYFVARNVVERSLCVQRKGERGRHAYFIPMVAAQTRDKPVGLQLPGAGMLQLLEATPCPSIPIRWEPKFKTWNEDAGAKYKKPRVYSPVEFAEKADGYTVHGPAVQTIRALVQDSIDAVCSMMGWSGKPHMAVEWSQVVNDDREVFIRPQDESIWQTIADTARIAGVEIDAYLWWPGDDPVTARPRRGEKPVATSWTHPIMVITIEPTTAVEAVTHAG
ncbi:hypothetical protein CIP107578_00758 [Corynebacterium diphtheriae]|nr:hypothetical protein CIP107532_01953 [Corynebacterium diphtheriae]CAB0593995.1 hypothetical protein CIP107558_00756 [Corynebacterium diphtheriae]CAB0640120.1 hypothetical protein CIP107578_00758 [Corynebacterium diphtheriae]CAB0660147.1 hypothetical protein CIP107562_01775 [Corynebacterium diphtheriae]CAB0824110.1 hypothetical protein FRC0290_01749 [Corynebacterium diphtheriae]